MNSRLPEYKNLHYWVKRNKGKADNCVGCNATGQDREIEWANISHEYHRDLDDFQAMCKSCHRKYDYVEPEACKNGHKFTIDTTGYRIRWNRRYRICKTCMIINKRRFNARRSIA